MITYQPQNIYLSMKHGWRQHFRGDKSEGLYKPTEEIENWCQSEAG